jgi:hypothetical protein
MRIVIAASIAALAACSASADTREFAIVPGAERVVIIADYGKDTLAEITDPRRIRELLEFVNARRAGWETPWAGVPVPRIRALFYRSASGGGMIRSFGAGPGFFEATSQPADFASRTAEPSEVGEFLSLLHASPDAAGAPSR